MVTVTSGDYTDIVQSWIDAGKIAPNGNGKYRDMFGNINLQTVQDKPKSGEGNFTMCIVDQVNNERSRWNNFRGPSTILTSEMLTF